jgi:AcrR family transcriptional regulator
MALTKPKTRDRIIASARELFFSKGLDDTSIADICRHSGVSNGSLFHHFPTKEAIALEIFLAARRHYWEHVLAAMEAESNVPDAAEASVRAAFDFQKRFSDEYYFMLDTAGTSGVLKQTTALKDLNAAFVERAMRWAAPYMMKGELPALSIHTFGALIFGLAQWVAREQRGGLSIPDSSVVTEELAALMRKMFTVDPPKDESNH